LLTFRLNVKDVGIQFFDLKVGIREFMQEPTEKQPLKIEPPIVVEDLEKKKLQAIFHEF